MTNMDDLNWKEQRVVEALQQKQDKLTIRELARACFPGVRPVEKADSQVRNALRKPRKLKLVRKVGEGTYQARS